MSVSQEKANVRLNRGEFDWMLMVGKMKFDRREIEFQLKCQKDTGLNFYRSRRRLKENGVEMRSMRVKSA